MKRRLVIVAVTVLGLCAGGTAAQAIGGGNRTTSTGDWGCAVIRPLNQGLCFENPLPPQLPTLPVPGTPA